jgi:hypothetical protein
MIIERGVLVAAARRAKRSGATPAPARPRPLFFVKKQLTREISGWWLFAGCILRLLTRRVLEHTRVFNSGAAVCH